MTRASLECKPSTADLAEHDMTTPHPSTSMDTPPFSRTGSAMPVGPWLLVVGMHRSGTSALTGALGHMGLAVPVPEDRWEPSEDNPDHFESRALGLHDDALLKRLDATWDGPPEPGPGWESDLGKIDASVGDPASAASQAFPNPGPVAWKDPRVCLLLPYWLARIPPPVAAVFVWRSPLSVARSLRVRDDMALADGVALWERYNRAALAGLVGIDTFVTRYESIVENPLAKLGALADWLGGLPQFAAHTRDWDLTLAAASISAQLQRQHPSGDEQVLLNEQAQLLEHLDSLDGPHGPLTNPPPGMESAWTTALLNDRRRMNTLRDTLAEHVESAEALAVEVAEQTKTERLKFQGAHAELARAHAQLEGTQAELRTIYELYERIKGSTSWRVTAPLRRIVALKGGGGGTPPAD